MASEKNEHYRWLSGIEWRSLPLNRTRARFRGRRGNGILTERLLTGTGISIDGEDARPIEGRIGGVRRRRGVSALDSSEEEDAA